MPDPRREPDPEEVAADLASYLEAVDEYVFSITNEATETAPVDVAGSDCEQGFEDFTGRRLSCEELAIRRESIMRMVKLIKFLEGLEGNEP